MPSSDLDEREYLAVCGCPPASAAGARRTRTMMQEARCMSLIFHRRAVPDVRNDFSWAADGQVAWPWRRLPVRTQAGVQRSKVACLPVFASI